MGGSEDWWQRIHPNSQRPLSGELCGVLGQLDPSLTSDYMIVKAKQKT